MLGLERDGSCPYLRIEPDSDEDGDGVLNGADDCPLVPGHDPHDEDGDGIPDGCDPCPMFADAGADRDCDAIGAACDLDDSIPHVQEFIGFGSSRGLQLTEDVAVAGDALQFRFSGTEAHGQALVTATVPAAATYEFPARLAEIGDSFCRYGLKIYDDSGADYEIFVAMSSGVAALRIRKSGVATPLESAVVGSFVGSADLTLRLEIADTTLTARVTGAQIGATEIATTLGALTDPVKYGISAYCDSGGSASRFDVPYLTRTSLAP